MGSWDERLSDGGPSDAVSSHNGTGVVS